MDTVFGKWEKIKMPRVKILTEQARMKTALGRFKTADKEKRKGASIFQY